MQALSPDGLGIGYLSCAGGNLFKSDIVTTTYFAEDYRSLLPWRCPFITTILNCFRRRQRPYWGTKKTTFACYGFRKEGHD
jgi:hypothetical protein